MKRSLPPVPGSFEPSSEPSRELAREQVARLGRLCAAVVVAGALLVAGTGAADAAAHPAHQHTTKHTKKHAKKHAKTRQAKKKHKAWVATGPHATVQASGAAARSVVTDPTGDVTGTGPLLRALRSPARRAVDTEDTLSGDADLTRATLIRDGDDVEITVDTSTDFTGEQDLAVGTLADVRATETFDLAVEASGGATVYDATATLTGSGDLAAGSAATLDDDGSVTFTVPVAALPRDAQLHVDLSTDLGVTADVLGLVSGSLSADLGDTLDFGFHTGS
ncbi:hypothetical protein P5P86_04610 [Nocardioides sp. BP30]|uniref:hypothetical protein n=1 Tax=Nocardioides sp. BP30 TaxID=3036374 RepID=UPI002468797A|nr:hypothetical protein [Nocardioides sp. BP30]WGL53107.1 hypothetical protein P5P86_04610 [Nocardioides sp. BP30]